MHDIARAILLALAVLFAQTLPSTACEACGSPHITLLGTAKASAYEASGWMKTLKKRGIEVHAIDCRNDDPAVLGIIRKTNVILIDGAPHEVRAWKPLIRLELERYLDAGKPVGFLWHGTAAQGGAPSSLDTRLKGIARVIANDEPAAGSLTGGKDHRNRSHCILRGVDLNRLAPHLQHPRVAGRDVHAVVSAEAADKEIPLVWTTSHKGIGERSGNIFVVQAADGEAFAAGPYSQLVANAIFWAMDWDDLIPATGVPLQ